MSRIIYPNGSFAGNRVAVEPPTDVAFSAWAYLGASAAASPNLVTGTAMSETGTPGWQASHVRITPAVNCLTNTGAVDVADQTIMFVARTEQVGGFWSPIISGYAGATGLMVGLGSNYIKLHPPGLSTFLAHSFAGHYGLDWSFWSIVLNAGDAVPIKIKNWTHNQLVTGGNALAARAALGQALTVGGHTATSGTYPGDVAQWAHAPIAMTDTQIERSHLAVQMNLASLPVPILV